MSQVSNINAVNANANTSTPKYFNNFNLPSAEVSASINDTIIGYFEQIADSKIAAKSMAGAVILTAISQEIDPMDTLAEFSQMPLGELNAYTTMFLNLSRKGTSYLGINNNPTTPKYIAHMIRP
jgi:hypothetical protein